MMDRTTDKIPEPESVIIRGTVAQHEEFSRRMQALYGIKNRLRARLARELTELRAFKKRCEAEPPMTNDDKIEMSISRQKIKMLRDILGEKDG